MEKGSLLIMTGQKKRQRKMAAWLLRFFRQADNVERRDLLDLDPRRGYVRLGDTKLREETFGYSRVRGLMNPKGDLQAVLTGPRGQIVLTVSAGLDPVVQFAEALPMGA